MRTFNLIKSFTTLVNNITSLPSREGLGLGLGKVRMGLRMLLLSLALATFGVNEVWGKYKANVTATSNPSSGGYVYVGTSGSCGEGSCTKNSDSGSLTAGGTFDTKGNVTLYLCHKNADGYVFKGWSTTTTTNTGEGVTSNPYGKSFAGSASIGGGTNYTYYAIFARMTADISSKDFGNVNVGQSSSATTITVTHAHASKITAALSGTNAGDFSLSKTTVVENSVSESTATFTVTFKPTCNGARNATLTLSSTNGLSDVTISLSGTGVLNSQSLSWNNESTIELNMLNGATQNISATATSGLAVSYSSSNSDVLSVDATGKLTAKSVGEATITVSQPGDGCTYSAATSISKTFNVKSKDTPIFTPNWSSTDIKVGDKVTLGVQYVSDGLTGDFKAKDYDSNILKVSRDGNTITIETLNEGASNVTFTQTETSAIFSETKTYSFTVSKIANTLAVDATHTMKIGETWTSVCSGINSDAELSVNNTHEEIATFDLATNTITAHQAGTTTITFSQAETYKYTAASKSVVVTVNKKDPAFTWTGFSSSMSWAQIINATCSSTNTSSDCPITITSNNPEIAYYADGKIYAYNKSGTATFTVHQAGNDYEWSEKSQNFSIAVTKPNNHVEVNVTSKAAYNALSPQTGGKAASVGNDGKITIEQGGLNWDDSYVDLTFTGVPNQLSFTTSKSGAATGVVFYVKEYVDGSWSGEIYNKTSAESATINLNPKATKIRLCYSGNLTGNFSSVRITERPASVEASDMIISGTHRMGDAATTQNLDINWYNVPQLTVTSSNPKFTFNGNETYIIPSSCDQSAEQVQVPITYAHDAVTTGDDDEATITFTSQNGVYTKTVKVKGRTDKKLQTLSWKDDFLAEQPVFRQDQEEVVAQSNQGLTPVYTITSSVPMGDDPSQPVFELTEDGTKIKGVFPGTATITATQLGNETVEEAEPISKTFKVSYKKAIQIKWNQNLMKLKSDGEPVTLTAKAYEQNSETGELVENTSKTTAIIYSSDNTSIVSISGSTLTIMGIGTTTIRAHIDGDDDFESADIAMSVKIRDASIVGCDDPLVLYAPGEVEFYQMNTNEIVKNEIAIDRSNGKHPDKLSFQHKGEYWKLVINYYKGSIKAQQKVNGSWTDIAGSSVTPTVGTYNLTENLQLNPDATHIRFVRPSGGQGYHYIKDVEVTLKHSLEVAETEHDFGTKKINEENVYCDFTINYFNIKANSLTVSVSGDVTVDKTETKDEECGTIGSDVVRVSLNTATEGDKSGTVTFKDAVTNQSLTVTFTGNIEKLTPEIVTLPTATATERLENPILADLTLQGGEASVEGTFTWKSSDTPIQEGDHTYWVVFTPSNTDLYKNIEFEIHVVLSSKTQYIEWDTTTEELYCGESITFDAVSKANSDNSETGFEVTYSVDDLTKATISDNTLTTLKAGTVVVTAHQVGTFSYLPATDVSKTIIIQPNVFTGEGGDDDWNNPANWKAGVPTDETPDASVKGDLTIQSDHKVNIFTIESGASVTIKNGATLTIKGSSAGRETYGDIIVENGGKLVIEETADSVCVQNVYLATSFGEHSSSQVLAADHLTVHGDAFFDITWADNANAQKWHAFTVPFPVDARKGIYDLDGNQLTNEVHYAIMSYHGDVRAQGKYGWAKFRNIMTPGTFYLMTVDGTIPTFRFRKTTGSDLAATNLLQVAQFPQSGDAQVTDAGWNGIGNSQLYYVSVDAPVQVLNPESYTYEFKNANECNFTVGTPFFYQASADGSVVLDAANGSNPAYAPARVGAAEIKDVNVMLSNNNYTDHLYLSATDEATAEYQIGRDLVKMTMTSTPSVPQIFALAYNASLCMVDAPLTNDEAQVSIRLYAPANGEYTLSVSNDAAADVYLLHNGMPVWNLSESAYTLDLEKGNTEGYSLRLRRAHKQTTDMDAVNGSDKGGVQKVIMDNQLYILRGGQIYTVTGQIR